jgi:TetR/AcrR family transcriptional regulator, fatty acid metabolism regulator protein
MIATISNRQKELIEAAGKILTASGVGGLTIKNLAREMDFSESAIYRHFASKEEIIVALLDYLAKNTDERYSEVSNSNLSPEEKFKALFKSQFLFFSQNPHFVVAVFSDGLMERKGKINEAILNIMAVKTKHLLPIITEGQRVGVFTRDLDSQVLMHIAMGTIRLQMFKWRVADFKIDITKKGDEFIQALLLLIKTK